MIERNMITEEDIFNYVIYPDSLSDEKRNYINQHLENFKQEIDYYNIFKIRLSPPDLEYLAGALEFKITKSIKVYRLTPNILPQIRKDDFLRLSAASVSLKKKTDSISFTDQEQSFLIRVISTGEQTKLYLFANEDNQKDYIYNVTLYPTNTFFKIVNPEEPVTIPGTIDIQSISVERVGK